MKNINKKEVVGWMKFWALGEKLAHSDQASWLSHVVMGVEEKHQEVSGLLGVCLSGTGALEGVRAFTHLPLQGVDGQHAVLHTNQLQLP